jgi:hypothetical protein
LWVNNSTQAQRLGGLGRRQFAERGHLVSAHRDQRIDDLVGEQFRRGRGAFDGLDRGALLGRQRRCGRARRDGSRVSPRGM